jgi:hypothetical protein
MTKAGVKEVFPGVCSIFRKIGSGVVWRYDLPGNYDLAGGDIKADDRKQEVRKAARIWFLSQIQTVNNMSFINQRRYKLGTKIVGKRLRVVNMILHMKIEAHGRKSPATPKRIWLPANPETVSTEKIDLLPKPIHYAESYHCGR